MFLHEQKQGALIRTQKLGWRGIPSRRRKVDSDWFYRPSRKIKRLLVCRNPPEYAFASFEIVRFRHDMTARVPRIRSCHELRHEQVLHRVMRGDRLVAVPGIVQDP